MKRKWKNAWVIGGSTGLGAALVRALAADDVLTYVSARNRETLMTLSEEKPSSIIPYPLDVTDQEDCARVVSNILNTNNGLPDLIILNAAVYSPMGVDNFNAAEISNMMNVNFLGIVNMISALLPHKNPERSVTIAAITSPSGWRGLPGGIGYGSSKAAVINLIESMKPELDGSGFDVRLVNPGFIKTRLTDKNKFKMPQLMRPDDAAARTLDGLSGTKFDISFPNPFLFYLKLLRILPYSLFFWVMNKMVKNKKAR
ncbi:MAG: SDR family NAD(P)-dependent oxidoreductase [Alphaproteobacteria bacterium]|nr:SDR family NAD(P)-dependent oxidoreductase [Alphaproteobacteria bacterium]HPF45636.1 SDR family NAD(P)-dependent oxidoreductase [Emcibacteraceae bacterium]HRW28763.1 SDR family NAD(P)-dependent oxidoreductase [Emcibacteraceae bacterium]